MAHPITALLPYVPPPLVQTLLAERTAGPAKETTVGVVLFADVSGFTNLSEALGAQGSAGTEELMRILNRYFQAMITVLAAHGGAVIKFSGDALTAFFATTDEPLAHTVRRGYQAAEAMQHAMPQFAQVTTSVGIVALTMKVALGAGTVYLFRVGGVFERWEYLIAGEPLHQVAEAEHGAPPGSIQLSPAAQQLRHPLPIPPRPLAARILPPTIDDELVARIRGYIPAAVRAWLDSDLGHWIDGLRTMSVVFVGIGGLAYEAPQALPQVDTFLRAVQDAVYRYEGSINKFLVDDKGTILMVLFGAPPFSHRDDPARAIACALDLLVIATDHALRMAIGVATGPVFSGLVGSAQRREYTTIGDTVNLAARLMGVAGRDQIRCDAATVQVAMAAIAFELLNPVNLKGKRNPVAIFRPLGRRTAERQPPRPPHLIGRQHECTQISTAFAALAAGACSVVVVTGEAGMGKSCLLDFAAHEADQRGIVCLRGAALQLEQHTPWYMWRSVLQAYFALPREADQAAQRAIVATAVAQVAPALLDLLALLNEWSGLAFPERAATRSLNAAARRESGISLVLTLLRARAAVQPLVLILDDVHWCDSISGQLLHEVIATMHGAQLPVLLVLGVNTTEGQPHTLDVDTLLRHPAASVVALGRLAAADTLAIAAARLHPHLPGHAIPPALAELLSERADGNPFFAEALALTLRETGQLQIERDAQNQLQCRMVGPHAAISALLPATIQRVILARYDRLLPPEQLVLRAGSAIGTSFTPPVVAAVLRSEVPIDETNLSGWLSAMVRRYFLQLERPPLRDAPSYAFKNVLIREAIYQLLTREQRRELHQRVARWYEQQPPGAALSATVSAYHWEQAGFRDKACAAWERAGSHALAISALTEAEYALRQALTLVRELGIETAAAAIDEARIRRLLGIVLWQTDRPEAAQAELMQSRALARVAHDRPAEIAAQTYLGRVLTALGRFDEAQAMFAAAISDAETRSTYTILRYLGTNAVRSGDLATARDYCMQALALARSAHDTFAVANIFLDLGQIEANNAGNQTEQANDYFLQSLQLAESLGNRLMMAIALGNLGEVATRSGRLNAARAYLERSLAISRAIGDREGENITLNNLGEVLVRLQHYTEAANAFGCGITLALERNTAANVTLLFALHGVACLWLADQQIAAAAELVAIILAHPQISSDLQAQAEATYARCATLLSADERATLGTPAPPHELQTIARAVRARLRGA